MTLVLLALVIGLVAGFAYGLDVATRRAADERVDAIEEAFERGKTVGADDLADEMIAAELRAPDFVERAWPRARARAGRPS